MLFSKIWDMEDIDNDFEFSNIQKIAEDVKRGDIYFCLTENIDKAKKRCALALKNGAKLVVTNFDFVSSRIKKVEDVRSAFSVCCKKFYDNACDDMKIIGVSGTNGKTTTTYIISNILKKNGNKVGLISTNGIYFNGKRIDCGMTTPDADVLHKAFFDMRKNGIEYVVMEVSAHAIAQKRVDGIKFDSAVLTNITQDHLDYFGTMENYEKTKFSFFTSQHTKKAIVCVDDERARKLIDIADIPVVTYGIDNPCDCFAIDLMCDINGSRFVGNICDDVVEIKTNLIGKYNIYNSLAGLCVCQDLGLDAKMLSQGLNFINPVEGRFNVINLSGVYVVVDYAHTPDGLMNILRTARDLTDKKVYVIFGCGGNRDKEKRAIMGKIAEEFADYVCLTNDNPRFEQPQQIIADIEKGMKKPHFVETNRNVAINKMLNFSQKGDIVIIAGKGAEKYQEIAGQKLPYNDFDAVYDYFKESCPFKPKGREFYDC